MIIRVRLKLAEEDDVALKVRLSGAGRKWPRGGLQPDRLLLVEDNLINMEIANMILAPVEFAMEQLRTGRSRSTWSPTRSRATTT